MIASEISMSIRNSPNLSEAIIFGPEKMKFQVKTLDLCWHSLVVISNCLQGLVIV